MNNQSVIYNIIGHTGCGKTTISKRIAEYYEYELLDFSYLGNEFAKNIKEKASTEALNSYVTNCIIAATNRTKRIVVDGLVSIDTVDELIRHGICCRIIYIDTPQALCISRIMKRNSVSEHDAVRIFKVKETGKIIAGLNEVISKAEFIVDGTQKISEIFSDVISFISSAER